MTLSRRIESLERRTRTRTVEAAWDAARREVLLVIGDPEATRLACAVNADGGDPVAALAALDARLMELREHGDT